MNKEELAERLDGREYPFRLTKEERQKAEEYGLVVVYGASDDFIEFEGAINDELCFSGGWVYIYPRELLPHPKFKHTCLECKHFRKATSNAKGIKASWDKEGYSWIYETDIPHVTFDVMEDGSKYCRGIIFDIKELNKLNDEEK